MIMHTTLTRNIPKDPDIGTPHYKEQNVVPNGISVTEGFITVGCKSLPSLLEGLLKPVFSTYYRIKIYNN